MMNYTFPADLIEMDFYLLGKAIRQYSLFHKKYYQESNRLKYLHPEITAIEKILFPFIKQYYDTSIKMRYSFKGTGVVYTEHRIITFYLEENLRHFNCKCCQKRMYSIIDNLFLIF